MVQLSRKPVSGYITADNRAYQLTGPWEALLVAGANSFTSLGERTEISVLESQGNSQTFGQASEEVFVGGSGLRIRLYAGAGRADPGSVLAKLGYDGQTRVGGAAATYPVIRGRALNLNLVGQFDLFESTVTTSPSGSPVRLSHDSVRALRVGADVSVRDALLDFAPAAASTTATIRLSQGIQAFGSSQNGVGTPGRVGSDFGFTKVTAEFTRNQPLAMLASNLMLSFEGKLAGQYTQDILPLSEQFYLGGTETGRGFYSGEVTGDNAIGASAELQFSSQFEADILPALGTTRLGTTFYVFTDYGRTWQNLSTDANRQLHSYGLGLRLTVDDRVEIGLEGVRRITRSPDGSGPTAPRLGDYAGFGRVLVRF